MNNKNFVDSFINWVRGGIPSPLTDAPIEYLTHVALMTISTAVNRRYYLGFAGRHLFPNLWIVLIGKSSFFHKSTSIALGIRILNKVDPEEKFLYENEFSAEQLLAILDKKPQGIFAVDEFSTFYSLFGRRYMEGGTGFLMEMYDRYTSYQKSLRSGETFYIQDPFINILAATTIDALEDTLKPSDLKNGFLARFHYVYAFKKDLEVELPGESDLEKETELIEFLRELRTRRGKLELSEKASEYYKAFYQDIKRTYYHQLQNGVSPFITRLLVSCLKYSILFHLADFKEWSHKNISLRSMMKATQITKELIQNAIRLTNGIALTPYEVKRRKVIQLLLENKEITDDKKYPGLSRSELMRKTKMHKREFNLVIESLLEERTIEIEDILLSPGSKKKTIIYKINPEIENEL